MGESISVVVMAYDEAPTLRAAVEEALDALERLGRRYEVLIIDDGSTDGTAEIADDLASESEKVRAVHHGSNKGMGGVYRSGFREAKNQIVYFMAADLQPVPMDYFETFLPHFDDHDVVIGYEPRRDAPSLSKLFSFGEKVLFQCLYPGVPKIGGPMMFRRALLDEIKLRLMQDEEDRSWMVLWELMIQAKRKGYRFARVRAERRGRAMGVSKGSTWRNALCQLRGLLGLRRVIER